MIVLALLAAALAQPTTPSVSAPAPDPARRFEVPADRGPQDVQVLERVFPVAAGSGWHMHPGVEMGTVIAGETEMQFADGTSRRYRAGESFQIPRGTIHQGLNVGTETVRLVVVYVTDRGQPLRSEAQPPTH